MSGQDVAQQQLGQPPADVPQAEQDDLRLWSVTTILDVLDSPGLTFWACERAALQAVAWADSLPRRLQEDGQAAVVKAIRDARFRPPADRLSDARLGTVVHSAAEQYALTGTRPTTAELEEMVARQAPQGAPAELPAQEAAVADKMLDRFDEWLAQFQPSYSATEVAVYSPTYGYAGTADAFLTIDGTRFLADYKTKREPWDGKGNPKRPYPDTALQLAAYANAELAAVWRPRRTEVFRRRYYLLGPAEQALAVPVPEVDAGLCLVMTTEYCTAYPMRIDPEVHRAFLYTLEVARFQHETARSVVGDQLVPPTGRGTA